MLLSQQRIAARISDLFTFSSTESVLNGYVAHKNRYWVGSAREGLRQVLLGIRGKRVGIPAYTCHVVLDAVRRAGCEPVFYDSGVIVSVEDIATVIKDVDVLVVCYNFGFVSDVDKIVELCREHDVVVVEDCAQAFGVHVGGFGEYAVYSFGLSKNIGFCGGMVASKGGMGEIHLPKYPLGKLLSVIGKVAAAPLLFNKYVYPLIRRFLQRELHKGQESLSYACSPYAKNVVLKQMGRYKEVMALRRSNFEHCVKELQGVVDFVSAPSSGLYFVLLVDNSVELKRKLLARGVEVGEMYTFQCFDTNKKKAAAAEKQVLTFALYRPLVEVQAIIGAIKGVCADGN